MRAGTTCSFLIPTLIRIAMTFLSVSQAEKVGLRGQIQMEICRKHHNKYTRPELVCYFRASSFHSSLFRFRARRKKAHFYRISQWPLQVCWLPSLDLKRNLAFLSCSKRREEKAVRSPLRTANACHTWLLLIRSVTTPVMLPFIIGSMPW